MYIVILEQGQLHKKAVTKNLILFIFLSLNFFAETPVVKGSEVIGREMKIISDCCWARHA